MTENVAYDSEFFDLVTATAHSSAVEVLTWLVARLRPTSVIDIGCGEGAWLAQALELGVTDIQGIDGDYVDRSRLQIPQTAFLSANLAEGFNLHRNFDLAICLEVAEHLDESAADTFVKSIVSHASVALFSAAVPLQQGTDHRNEQWPESWIARFTESGWKCFDVVRPQFWKNAAVSRWYRQNMLLFVRPGADFGIAAANELKSLPSFHGAAVVHPEYWLLRNGEMAVRAGDNAGPKALLSKLPKSLLRAIGSRIPFPK